MAGRSTTTTAAKARAAARRRAAAGKPAAPAPVAADSPSEEQIKQAVLQASLADIALGSSRAMAADNGMEARSLPVEQGLQLEEISQLLTQREHRGYMRGHSEGYSEARRHLGGQLNVVRSGAVSNTLQLVVGELEGVLHELAKTSAQAKRAGAQRLAVLIAELGRASDRHAGRERDEAEGF